MRIMAFVLTGLALTGCASTDGYVDRSDDLLSSPQQNETLGETLLREQRDGCLAGGSALSLGCSDERREWAELLGPPQAPEGITIPPPPPPPPPPPQPDDD